MQFICYHVFTCQEKKQECDYCVTVIVMIRFNTLLPVSAPIRITPPYSNIITLLSEYESMGVHLSFFLSVLP